MRERQRENLATRESERWRPPAFAPVTGIRSRVGAGGRRLLDLQAGSMWRDLREPLAQARGTVVDVGCGAQPYRHLLSDATEYIGLDTERAREDFGYTMPDVLTIGTDGRWPLADARAEVVLATETLEHVPDPAAFLAEAERCLRPGGRIILTVPFAARWHYVPHDYWRFTPSSLRMLLEAAGFTEVVVHARGNETTVAAYKLLSLLLPAALPQTESGSVRPSPLALLAAPLILVLALVGKRSLRAPAGDDCLGYTVFAVRSEDP